MPTEPDLTAVLAAIADAPRAAVVLIDGPSGSGKSTLADRLLADWPTDAAPQLLRLDDVYPGWGGLAAGAEQVRTGLLHARSAGRPARWRRWDWLGLAPAEWHEVAPDRPVIVEGCGALAGDAAAHADVTVWVSADDTVRKRRALERDAGGFDAHWDEWQAQWELYEVVERPRDRAQIVLEAA
ncbi:nucleoside/nucleotide kinase family protein [Microterricola pindariensis]|uniref:ATP-binding protein n=1 Tax=Microterricola pindariensis TaxID=478010 RepID=UPI001374F714|nr:ATP-binding protein [Microterricola pindariensis]